MNGSGAGPVADWLFIAPNESTFVIQDLEIIASVHKVKKLFVRSYDPISTILSQFRIVWFLLNHVWSSKGIFMWFADYHSVIPALLGALLNKKVIIVIGGYDAAKYEEVNHGAHINPIRSFVVKLSCSFSTHLLAVSRFARSEINRYVPKPVQKKIAVVHNGINVDYFQPLESVEREPRIISVSKINSKKTFLLKGIDYYIRLATVLSQFQFLHVGMDPDFVAGLKDNLPKNLKWIPSVGRRELLEWLSSSSVYCQMSRYESFGVALVEAMAVGCIPVGFDVSATSEIIDGVGYLVKPFDIEAFAQSVKDAVSQENRMRSMLHSHVTGMFALSDRSDKILEYVQ